MQRIAWIFLSGLLVLAGCSDAFGPSGKNLPSGDIHQNSGEIQVNDADMKLAIEKAIRLANLDDADKSEMSSKEYDSSSFGPSSIVAGLGDPSRQGIWIEAPLADIPVRGIIRAPSTGREVEAKILPTRNRETGSAWLSLEAMRLLEVPLTDLVEVEIRPEEG